MGFSINNKKNRQSLVFTGNKSYHKLRSIEDLSNYINNDDKRFSTTSTNSEIRIPTCSTYNKRFSEQSFNSISNVSMAETYCSTNSSTTASVVSNDINNIYAYYQTNNENDNIYDNSQGRKKQKKHRRRKALSKIFQSFAINNQLQQSMQCPDWEYYCNQKNYNVY